MRDEDKTRSQLLVELQQLQARVAALEGNSTAKKLVTEHDHVMRQSDDLMRLVLDATNIGIWDWYPKTGQAYFNPRYYTMLGYEPDDFAASYDSWRQLIHPDDVEVAEAAVHHALAAHSSFSVELRLRACNGTYRWILCQGDVVERDAEGQSTRMVGSHTDIDQRRQTEESLRLTQFIFEKAPIGIWRMGAEGNVLDVNEQGASALGFSRDELQRMAVFDFAPDFYPADWREGLASLNSIGSRVVEMQHQRATGEIFPIQVVEKLVRFEDEVFHVAFVQDITERKRIEASLRLARSIIDKANVGIYLICEDGRLKEVNQKAADILGYTKAELEAMNVADLDSKVRQETWRSHWQKLNLQDSRNLEREHRKKDRSLIPVEIHSNLLEYEGKQYAVAFVQDISRRKQSERAIREKDRLLQDIGRLVKVGGWKVDLETGIATSTDEVARICDFDQLGEVTVEDGLSCYHGVNRERIERAFREAVAQGISYDLELEMISAKGIHKWVRTVGQPVMRDGRVVEVQGSLQDISAIKRAKKLLTQSEKRYRVLIELAPVGIAIVNNAGMLVDANQFFATMLGYEVKELLELSFRDITHPEDLVRETELLQALAKNEIPSYSLEKRYKHKSGHFFWINITVGKTSDIYGPGVFYFGFVEEITNRKKLEVEREKLISDLQKALAEIRELRGYIPICAKCKKVRDDEGYWQQVEKYIMDRTEAQFSHSICPDCANELYPNVSDKFTYRKPG